MTPTLDLEDIWQSTLGELEVELGKSNFQLYFKNSQLLSLESGVAKIGFPNKIMADQVNARYYTLVQASLRKISKQERLSLVFEITTLNRRPGITEDLDNAGPLFETAKEDAETIIQSIKKAHLRSDFTLEQFCVSTSNQLAFAAAQAAAQNPGKNYNPLFLWGGVGVGKTHLMQAIGHEILRQSPRARVIYLTCEQFTNEIIEGIRNKNTKDFKDKYRPANALLVDDIQFLSGKDRAQEEFFHTFNAIQQNDGQIVLTADTKPTDIKYIEDRLRSRFGGGMVADISTPDHELKVAICILKAKKRGIELSNSICSLIASNVDNIRSLEGTLQRILSEAQFKNQEITEDFVATVLKVSPSETPLSPRLDGRLILDAVCQFYNLPIKLIKGEKRDKPIAQPRQITMYLLKKNTSMTLEEIAAFLGGRDHSTVLHGVRKIESLISTNDRIKEEVTSLQGLLFSH